MPRPFRPEEIMADLSASVSKDMREVGLRVLTAVIFPTPVDTGHARANWHATIGAPSNEELALEDASGGPTIARGEAVIGAYPRQGQLPALHIQNAVPYIRRLNEGHSQQAPAGFVEAGVQAAVERARSSRAEV